MRNQTSPLKTPERRRRRAVSAKRKTAALLTLLGLVATSGLATYLAKEPTRLTRWWGRVQLATEGGIYHGTEGMVLQTTLSDCGPAALANLLTQLEVPVPSTNLLKALAGTGPSGTRASGLIRAASAFGVSLSLVRVDSRTLSEVSLPLIAWVRRSHFVTVIERTRTGRVLVLDPQVGRYSISETAFQTIWSGEAIILRRSGRITPGHIGHGHSSPELREKVK